jgi:hypothetical protein
MTTEIQIITALQKSEIASVSTTGNLKFSSASAILEEKKTNAVKPLSLRPNRSVKKNSSLKPLGLRTK